jgi:hypothetical protein
MFDTTELMVGYDTEFTEQFGEGLILENIEFSVESPTGITFRPLFVYNKRFLRLTTPYGSLLPRTNISNNERIEYLSAIGSPILPWILSNSIWNDDGIWYDTETWSDT